MNKNIKRLLSFFLTFVLALSFVSVFGVASFGIDFNASYLAQPNYRLTNQSFDGCESTEKTTYKYDDKGNLIKESHKESNGFYYVSSYEYDKNGNTVKQVYKDSNKYSSKATNTYNKNGVLIKSYTKDSDKAYTLTTFNDQGLMTLWKTWDASGASSKIKIEYDKNSNVVCYYISVEEGEFVKQNNKFDKKNRLVKSVSVSSDGDKLVEAYTYDKKGNVLTKSSKLSDKYDGYVCNQTYEYNSKNVLIKETYKNSLGIYNVTTYNDNGDITKDISVDSQSGKIVSIYTYNKDGKILKETRKEDSGYKATTTYSYDSNGNLIKEQFKNNEGDYYIEKYTFDSNGNLIKDVFKDESGFTSSYTYSYDKNGNKIKETYKDSEYSYTQTAVYDDNSRLIEESKKEDGMLMYNAVYAYDENGNRSHATVNDADGNTENYKFTYKHFDLNEKQIDENSFIRLSENVYKYDGKAKTPKIIIASGTGMNFSIETDEILKVKYYNNTKVGTAKVKIIFSDFLEDYGTIVLPFEIVENK